MAWNIAKIEAPTITLEDYEEIALNTIASKMGEFEEVQAVYTQKYQSEIVVYVFLKVEEYDEELMDRLLDKEYVIRKQFSDLVFNFLYPPTGIVAREDFVHPQARCIFHAERTYGGKIGTSFAG